MHLEMFLKQILNVSRQHFRFRSFEKPRCKGASLSREGHVRCRLNVVMRVEYALLAFLIAVASPTYSQVVPAATGGSSLTAGRGIAVGGGGSYWDVDWGRSRMEGATLWVDWTPVHLPSILGGLSFEAEARDVRFHPGDKPSNYREVTGGGGAIYTLHPFRNFHVYGKGLLSFGRIYFGSCLTDCSTHPYLHDTQIVYAYGGGLEYRVFRHVWARAEYEYQFWPNLTGNTFLDPQGFTAGVLYDFRHRRRH
jgi:opacity protein-like surface antigen